MNLLQRPALLAAVTVGALLLGGCAGERLGGIEQDPDHAPPRPELPFYFEEWGVFQRHDRSSVYYATEDLATGVHVSVYQPGEFDRRLEQLTGAAVYGTWWCGRVDGVVATAECFTLAWDEEVNLSSEQLDPAGLAAFGDQLMAAWDEV